METIHGKVLLVEDNPDDVTFVQMAFKKAGLGDVVTVVSDGGEALKYLGGKGPYGDRRKFPVPSLMMLDLRLPTVDGFEVIRWVRSHPSYKRLPITVFTGSSYPKHLHRAYELGANSVVVKPFTFVEFCAAITKISGFWLDCCKLPDPAASASASASP
jgi:CheY-like chemotaxis protein